MKKYLCFIAVSLCFHPVFAQRGMDSLMLAMNRSKFKCEDVSAQSMQMFMDYYRSGAKDSIPALLAFWESKCGNTEAVQRTKILFAIDNNVYNDTVIESGILDLVFDYKSLKTDALPETYLQADFNRFTRQLAEKNKARFLEDDIEYAWCDFYGFDDNSIFYYIQKHQYPDSKLTEEYFQSVEQERSKRYNHLGFTAGCWIPTGSFTAFGTHPEVGLIVGFKYKRWGCDMNVNLRFLQTPKPYDVQRYDEMEQSQRFTAVNVGFDVGFDLLYLPKHKIAVLGGIGYEGFNALQRDNVAGLGPVNINTYNIAFGTAYTFHVNASFYWGFQAKCHFVDYTLNGSMDYNGVPFTLKLKTGWTIHDWHKPDKLHELKYKDL
ncbi:MAG: hypothetical protein FWG84_00615 [Bacteroidales bacterium]|nr:hypothetical protein [Bacteroidales bacterium]